MKALAGTAQAVPVAFKGRGATDNPKNRYERQGREACDDG